MDGDAFDAEFWQEMRETRILKNKHKVIKCVDSVSIADGWIQDLIEFMAEQTNIIGATGNAEDLRRRILVFLRGGKIPPSRESPLGGTIPGLSIPIPLSMDYAEIVQMIDSTLRQTKPRGWYLHIKTKGRKVKHRGPKGDFDYRRRPVR